MGGKRQKCDVHHGRPRAASFLFWPGLRVSSVGCGNHDDGGYLCRAADIFAWLLIGHALAKYPLQGEWTKEQDGDCYICSVRPRHDRNQTADQVLRDGRWWSYRRGDGRQRSPLLRAGHWLSRVELDARSPVWMHWLRELSRGLTYIRYDQRGGGLSDAAPASLSLEAWIGDLEAVADALGLRRFALFGMSQGGAIAIAYAARHPERVSHLVLLGTPVRGKLRRGGTAEQQEEGEMLLNLARIGWGRDNPAFRQVFTTLFMPDGTPEQHCSLNELVRVSTSPENAVAIHEALYQLDITALAKAVHVPTLVLHAHGDAIIPFEEGRHLATLIQSWQEREDGAQSGVQYLEQARGAHACRGRRTGARCRHRYTV